MKNQCLSFILPGLIAFQSMNLYAQEPLVSPYLDSEIMVKMETGHMAGLSACIIKNGEVSWNGNYGYANIEVEVPVDTSALFYNASISKTVTATPLIQLWEDGLFELDDDINDYLSFDVYNPNYPEEPITFRMLCTHTSSIDNNPALLPVLWGEDPDIPLGQFLYDYAADSIPCSCLPEGITFATQAQIDSFQVNYPGCAVIEGDVTIGDWYSTNITDLEGLNVITNIGGYLKVLNNDSLCTLDGLNNLTQIEGPLTLHSNDNLMSLAALNSLTNIGGLTITQNNYLSSLTGLENLAVIGGDLYINMNGIITNLSGLNNLTTVVGDFQLGKYDFWAGNWFLESLNGLENLISIGGDFILISNWSLTSLSALENLASIGGSIQIRYNDALTSLVGLGNIDPGSISELQINNNNLLSECDAQSICDYLAAPGGTVNIYNNAPGCNSPDEALANCNDPLLDFTFNTQEEIDSFHVNYPGISEIEGNVMISGDDINNLEGLWALTSIGNTLSICGNEILSNLSGLNNMTMIGGDLIIGSFSPKNFSLSSLTGLESLISIGGTLKIIENDSLTSLDGLENIDPVSIYNLRISHNNLLSECDVQSICDYLIAPNGTVEIFGNASGCNSPEEVEEACLSVYIEDANLSEEQLNIYPNPVFDRLTISGLKNNTENLILRIFGSDGAILGQQQLSSPSSGEQEVRIDMGPLPAGMYFIQLQSGDKVFTKKVIKR